MHSCAEPLLFFVDDDPDQLGLLRIAASRAGVKVVLAESGQEALVLLRARSASDLPNPDLIVTDLKMPGMDGVEFMQRVRMERELAAVPFAFLTSSIYNRDRVVAHLAGADGFFSKPMNFTDLVALLNTFVRMIPMPVQQETKARPLTQNARGRDIYGPPRGERARA